MRLRRLANAVAAIFLLGVVAAVGIAAGGLVRSENDDYDVQVLSRDLQQFDGPVGDPSMLIDLQPCTGEGSVPAAARRRYIAPGTIATVKRSVAVEATALGWLPKAPPDGLAASERFDFFQRGDRDLSIEVTRVDASRVEVWLTEEGGDVC